MNLLTNTAVLPIVSIQLSLSTPSLFSYSFSSISPPPIDQHKIEDQEYLENPIEAKKSQVYEQKLRSVAGSRDFTI